MESFVLDVFSAIFDFMKTHYVWGEITIFQASVGFFVVEGIYSAFCIGRVQSEREEK